MSYIRQLLQILEKDKASGEKYIESTGAFLIGHVPHIAPQAWLHAIFNGIPEEDVKRIEKQINLEIPSQYRTFLNHMNGLTMYSNTLNLYGLRSSFERTANSIWQPFSIIPSNTTERIKDASSDMIFIGIYNWDGSKLYINQSNKVFRCSSKSTKPLNEWNSFEEMIIEESNRISNLFINGKEINSKIPTTP